MSSPRLLPTALAALAIAGAAPVFAAASPAETSTPEAVPAIRPVVGVLVTGTIGNNKITVTNPDASTANGSLSGRYEAFAGAEFPVDPNGLAIRVTAGLHAGANFRNNTTGASQHLTSIPLEATLWYPLNDKVRAGGGLRYAMHTRFGGAGAKTSDGLNPAPAFVAGLDIEVMPHLLVDVRYVYQRYEQSSGGDLEASHFGLGLTARY